MSAYSSDSSAPHLCCDDMYELYGADSKDTCATYSAHGRNLSYLSKFANYTGIPTSSIIENGRFPTLLAAST